MTDDLKAPERTFDHPYELSHSDGEWWTLKSNGFVVASFSLKTWGSAERIIEAAWQYAYGQPDADRSAALESALADMTRQRDAAMAGAVKVKPLVWVKHPSVDIWRADTAFGTYKVFGLGPTPSWDFDSFSDLNDKTSKSAESVTAAKAAAQADYNARVLYALTPDPDRMLALTAAAEAQAEARGMRKAADRAQEIANAAREVGMTLKMGSKAQIEIMERCWGAEDARMAIHTLADATEAAAKGGV